MARPKARKAPKRKYTKKKAPQSSAIPKEYKQSFIALLFILFAGLVLIADTQSVFGAFLSRILTQAFWEYYIWIFSPVLLLSAAFMFWKQKLPFNMYRLLGLILFYIGITTLIWFFVWGYSAIFDMSGHLEYYLWKSAVFLTAFIAFILSLIMLFRFSPIDFARKIVWGAFDVVKSSWAKYENEADDEEITKKKPYKRSIQVQSKRDAKFDKKKEELSNMLAELKAEKVKIQEEKKQKQLQLKDAPKKIRIEKRVPEKIKSFMDKKDGKNLENNLKAEWWILQKEFKNWEFPSVDLLDNKWWKIKYNEAEIKEKEIEIQEKLLQFNIDVSMQGFNVWPTVIQYRLKPRAWVALKKIVNLKQDLTLALHAKNIRIQAPIPGQGVVWIEVPNPKRQAVWLKEVLLSKAFNNPKINIPLALWKNVNWEMIVGDLTKMPHLLVAWQTASGKSVWINAFLMSMLYKFSPSELKLILIDPKIVELSVYNGIPHLLTPVITNASKALNSLKWCVAEMLRRYDLARQVWARNLDEYNEKVDKKKKLPYIVLVLDELADLMMSGDKKEVEWNITRIAQMARAVWMHLIIATQRPSVNIITWVIKANVPSRVAFTVSSQIDSQTILWKKWAEDLLWMWDMLYYPTGQLEPQRVQWVFVETHEVEAVITKLKLTVDPDMLNNMQDDTIVNGKSKTAGSILENYQWDQEESPEIIEKAMMVVKEAGKWSTSLVQRKLSLWYARAAKVLDILEELWVVWPANGSKPREVYVD